MMPTRKSNALVNLTIHPDFRRWAKIEAAKRGKSLVQFSEEWAKANLEKSDVKLGGFKLNF